MYKYSAFNPINYCDKSTIKLRAHAHDNNGQLPISKEVQVRYVLCAIKLGEYFLSHGKRVYGLAYKDDLPARSLSEKLATLGVSFTRSQIRNTGWADLKTKEERREAIKILINRGYISQQIQGKFYVNPACLDE